MPTASRATTLNKPLDAAKCNCGGFHLPEDHWQFASDMPQNPADLIDDFVKMGLYQPQAISLAETLSHTELKTALFIRRVAGNDPNRERLCNELIQQAGGLDEAFAAAFGSQSARFFNDTIRNSDFSRRDFLQKIAAAAALIALSSCGSEQATTPTQPESLVTPTATLEKTDLKIGFIPITCATPIIMSEPLGFYKKYGLNAKVIKMPNWAAVRDSAIAGELDAYHMLSPMPIAMTLGLGSTAFSVKLASIENINGQAITVSLKHKDKVKGPEDFKGFKIGVPFPFSMHNLLLRYYLASGGVDPDQDVQIFPVPPPDSVAKLSVGDIDAMLMPDPFNQRAVYEKAGFIHMLSKDLWAGHPCCAFAASDKWIGENPNTFRQLNKAIIDGAGYASKAENRKEIAKAISARQFLNQPEEVVAAVLTGEFEDGLGNKLNVPDRVGFDPYPWQSFSKWIASQMVRWDFIKDKEKVDYDGISNTIFMTDLARELAKEVGQTPPIESTRIEKLKFDEFDPANPAGYVEAQIKKYKV